MDIIKTIISHKDSSVLSLQKRYRLVGLDSLQYVKGHLIHLIYAI